MKYWVLLVDYKNSEVSSEIPYLFHRAGAVVDVYCSNKSWLKNNKYWAVWHDSHDESPEKFASQLEALVTVGDYDRVILTDESALHIMNNEIKDEVLATKILPVTNLNNRIMLGSKSGLSILCQTYGIQTPQFVIYADDLNLNATFEKIGFPLLLKIDFSGGGRGVFLCNTAVEAQEKIASLSETQKNNLLIQAYIPGETIGVEAIFDAGELRGYVCSKVVHTSGSAFAVSVEREYFVCPELESIIQAAGNALTIHGLASMTYLQHAETKEFYLVEADLRANAWFRLAEFAGMDFSEALRNCFVQKKELLRPTATGIFICIFSRHIMWSLRNFKVIEISKWIFNVGGRWRFIPWYDKKLLYANIRGIVRACAFLMRASLLKVRSSRSGAPMSTE